MNYHRLRTLATETADLLACGYTEFYGDVRNQPRAYAGVAVAALIVFFVLLWLAHRFSVLPAEVCVFGADNTEIFDGLAKGWLIFSKVDLIRHAPQTVGYTMLSGLLHGLGVPVGWAIPATMALCGAACWVFILVGVRKATGQWLGGVLAATLCLTLFGLVVSLVLVDNYVMTAALVALTLLTIVTMNPRSERPLSQAIWVGLFVGLAGLAHLPALGLLIFYLVPFAFAVRDKTVISSWIPTVVASFVAAVLVSLPHLAMLAKGHLYVAENASHWATLSNFNNMERIAGVMSATFAFSSVSPLAELKSIYSAYDLLNLISSPLRLVSLTATIITAIYSIYILIKSSRWSCIATSYIAYIGVIVFFHIYYNPSETILYSVIWLVPTVVLVGIAASLSRHIAIAAIIAAVLTASVNWPLLVFDTPPPAPCYAAPETPGAVMKVRPVAPA